ncbi:unnamed protein product, partial [Vitis vinifera]|uniref:Uncharacterized protein n=1 Tax=Vitis vinifera TaxID=29760 RepID=D7SVV3_VITVI
MRTDPQEQIYPPSPEPQKLMYLLQPLTLLHQSCTKRVEHTPL